MSAAIRLSPSGPVIAGPGGGPLVPGSGMRLRLVQGTCTGGDQQIPNAGGVIGEVLTTDPLIVSLPLPNPGLQYRASVRCDVANPSTVQNEVNLYIDTSEDGIAWTQEATNVHWISGGTTAHNGAREISLDLTLHAGSAIGVTATPQSPALYVRARIQAFSAGAGPSFMLLTSGGIANEQGTVLLELEETL